MQKQKYEVRKPVNRGQQRKTGKQIVTKYCECWILVLNIEYCKYCKLWTVDRTWEANCEGLNKSKDLYISQKNEI